MDFRSENVTVAAREIIAALDAKTLEYSFEDGIVSIPQFTATLVAG